MYNLYLIHTTEKIIKYKNPDAASYYIIGTSMMTQ